MGGAAGKWAKALLYEDEINGKPKGPSFDPGLGELLIKKDMFSVFLPIEESEIENKQASFKKHH